MTWTCSNCHMTRTFHRKNRTHVCNGLARPAFIKGIWQRTEQLKNSIRTISIHCDNELYRLYSISASLYGRGCFVHVMTLCEMGR